MEISEKVRGKSHSSVSKTSKRGKAEEEEKKDEEEEDEEEEKFRLKMKDGKRESYHPLWGRCPEREEGRKEEK